MKTAWKNIIGACALVGVTTLVTTQVVSQEYGSGDQPEMPDMDAMMQEWLKLGEPGPEHAKMAKFAGKWKQVSKHWDYPGAEPNVSEGIATFEPIFGGRYMIEKTRSKMEFGGEMYDFEGFGLFGYDNMKEKHFFAWVDNLSTMIMVGEGTGNEAGDEVTYMSSMPDPMSGGTMKFKTVSKMVSDDHTMLEMYQKQPDGTWFKNMTIKSERMK